MLKDSVLVIGALSPVARLLIPHLQSLPEVGYIRGVDRRIPDFAYLTPDQQTAFSKIDYVQSSLLTVGNPFSELVCDSSSPVCDMFRLVFIFPFETKPGQVAQAYDRNNVLVAKCIAEAAAECSNEHTLFVLVSGAAHAYTVSENEGESLENSAFETSNRLSPLVQSLRQQDEMMRAVPNISLVVLRPASLYGKGLISHCVNFLAIYRARKALRQSIQEFCSPELIHDMVHIEDVVRACLHVPDWYKKTQAAGSTKIFNVATPAHHPYRKLLALFCGYFQLEVEEADQQVQSTLKNLTNEQLKEFLQEQNQIHCEGWTKLLQRDGIFKTPVCFYIDEDMLLEIRSVMDGRKICQETGFAYQYNQVEPQAIAEWVHWLQGLKWFPLDHDDLTIS